ncbi:MULTISPECIES: osmoprotectant ABC transporter ATP-binding protein OsmV [Enterobacterales]|jgi:osmoprotectant transport system ATP-binding protein|uniref:osmoprotectant ABC transporter ATP-binding protein OsmV n=1 Tax=Enterobacterales TaxID=91347 RepID=UPI00077BD366|nr:MULTISPECIES: osmoprotectant ABC transporter ATP-binding protein OsmV [Enterobacterales]MDY0926825.1 osmoprotectant ABC transporter ATP-binding protein OsmV [Enterobacter sp. CFBP8995]MRS20533.1 osmoprotectant ABC transporter ATP-binding protein OsmV [Enterobacteriaceae bacterium RIT692]MBB3303551.1 osmoprotectant transport system ATP-binding protein [Enterobacter sp. Sphag1F]MEA5103607.1 osmoprotectant ABC transporter ATP-binding protein OsmV [Pantoea sp. S18]NYI13344.1 osmoprotectant tran
MIKLENLTKTFTQKNGTSLNAVDNVSLEVPAGEMCVLLGPSGCGKTTTLKMINRLIPSSSGRILINGEDTSGQDTVTLRRNIGYVIQQIGLFPNMTIEENITVVPRMLGWDKKRCRERATELMSMVALDPTKFLHRYPREMSGGQQQRIGVIRALAADPPVLLMDEPFGAVDPINREVIQNEFLEMQRQLKKTVMLVSHDIDEALKLGDRIAVFGQGKIVQCASPDELLAKPANDFVGSFVGQDRTLKRLLLVQAGDVTDQQPTITVQRNTPLQDAFATMDDNDMRSVTVVDEDGKPLGFVKRREARGSTGRCEEMLHTFKVTGKAEENLRVVLSKLYEHNTVWMPIVDEEGRYSGEISQDYIADYLSSGRTRRRLNP